LPCWEDKFHTKKSSLNIRRLKMITVGISKWPTESAHEVGKRSLEMKLPPDFVQVIGPYFYPDENEGITAITIYKYDKSKAGEASEAIANTYMVFFGVPGFEYSTKLASGAAATKKMMGLE
jgi:hypothetical protein